MSRALEDYRAVQIDIRLLTQALSVINDAEKTHPEKATQYDALVKQDKWSRIKQEFTKRREALKKQLNDKQETRDMLYLNLMQTPLSLQSLAEIIDTLTSIEASFSIDGPNAAWDQLSGVIDNLEQDAERITKLRAVKAA